MAAGGEIICPDWRRLYGTSYIFASALPLGSKKESLRIKHLTSRPLRQFLIGISVFYGGEKLQCGKYCEQANCIDFVPGLCNFDLHEEL